MTKKEMEISFAPDELVMLVSPYSHDVRARAQLGNLSTKAREAFFNAAIAEDPGFEKFKAAVGLCSEKHGLIGGLVSGDLALLVGEPEALENVYTELNPIYEVTICTGRDYCDYVSGVQAEIEAEADSEQESDANWTRNLHS